MGGTQAFQSKLMRTNKNKPENFRTGIKYSSIISRYLKGEA